jgi:hypothetical protein
MGAGKTWEGWIEFVPLDSASTEVVVSAVESRQSTKEDLKYWACGLTTVYAEGSLDRALHPIVVHARIVETPASSRPASRIVMGAPRARGPEPVLNPFDVGAHSLDVLAQELRALNRVRLLDIISGYGLNQSRSDLASMTDADLIHVIVTMVAKKLVRRVK